MEKIHLERQHLGLSAPGNCSGLARCAQALHQTPDHRDWLDQTLHRAQPCPLCHHHLYPDLQDRSHLRIDQQHHCRFYLPHILQSWQKYFILYIVNV